MEGPPCSPSCPHSQELKPQPCAQSSPSPLTWVLGSLGIGTAQLNLELGNKALVTSLPGWPSIMESQVEGVMGGPGQAFLAPTAGGCGTLSLTTFPAAGDQHLFRVF